MTTSSECICNFSEPAYEAQITSTVNDAMVFVEDFKDVAMEKSGEPCAAKDIADSLELPLNAVEAINRQYLGFAVNVSVPPAWTTGKVVVTASQSFQTQLAILAIQFDGQLTALRKRTAMPTSVLTGVQRGLVRAAAARKGGSYPCTNEEVYASLDPDYFIKVITPKVMMMLEAGVSEQDICKSVPCSQLDLAAVFGEYLRKLMQ